MRTAMALLALMTLAGCTVKYDLSGSEWKKPGSNIQETTLDEMECVREAREAGYTPDLIVGGLVDVGRMAVEESQRAAAYRRCMIARGYN